MTRILAFLLLSLCLQPLDAWSTESTLRVAFVYNFLKFIEWPQLHEGDELRLCILGENTEAELALAKINGKVVGNKQIINLLHLKSDEDIERLLPSCQMVYQPLGPISVSLPKPLPRGVLIVIDELKGQDPDDVAIALIRNKEGRIEFTINNQAVERSGVIISSQLLKLAKNPRRGS
jgi:hypothetical protein